MATRSTIAIENLDGTIYQIYCHYDGYISEVGKTLFESYQDRSKVEDLIKLGALSILGKEIGEQQDFDAPTPGWTLAYCRDRGEDFMMHEFENFDDYEQNRQEEGYEYLFTKDNVWSVDYRGEWQDLEEEVQKIAE